MFECKKCGAQYIKWQGRCTECGSWEILEENESKKDVTGLKKGISGTPSNLVSFSDLKIQKTEIIKTEIEELNLVLGGGIIPGSLILISGEPGIGKSTLLMQICSSKGIGKTLYMSGEETAFQVKSRADRLEVDLNDIFFINETNIENIIATIEKEKPKLVVIDSIQTIYSNDVESLMGGVNQIRACTSKVLGVAKELNIPIILVGHITKDGTISGPKTMEHMVDTVLYLEEQKFRNFRILRATKNRFGDTNEIGVFEMTKKGLISIKNPSEIFINKNSQEKGNIVTCILEGSRAFLIEVQALVSKTNFGYPKRTVSGMSLNRLEVIIAVLNKKLGIPLNNFDIYINVVGGLNTKDTGIDLAVASAIISAYSGKNFGQETCIFGEIGLSGEVRQVSRTNIRLKEIQKLGFKKIIIPNSKIEKQDNLIIINSLKELLLLIQK